MSYAATVTATSTAQGHSETTPFLTVGTVGGAPAWPTDSGGDQIMREGRNSQAGSTDLGQAAPNWPADWQTGLGPFGRPDFTNTVGNIPGGSQSTQQRTTPPVQQQGQAPPASPTQAQGPPGGQPPAGAQGPPGPPGGPPGGQPPQGPPGGPLGGQPQAVAPQQVGQAPQGTSETIKGAPPEVFKGERSQTSKFMLQFQIWWMVNNRAEAMINPFQRIALCLSFIRGKKVDRWVEEKINQLRRAVVGDPIAGIPPTYVDTDERLWHAFGADFQNTFQDTAAEENAYEALKSLTMKDD
jgi:hypothetical protein